MCTAGYVHRPPFVFFMTSCRIRPDRASPSASALLPCQRQALTCRHDTSVSAISSWSPMLPYDGTHRPFFCHSPAHAAACSAPPPPDKAAQPRFCSSTVAGISTLRGLGPPVRRAAACRTAPRLIDPPPLSSLGKRDRTKQPATSTPAPLQTATGTGRQT